MKYKWDKPELAIESDKICIWNEVIEKEEPTKTEKQTSGCMVLQLVHPVHVCSLFGDQCREALLSNSGQWHIVGSLSGGTKYESTTWQYV